MRRIIVFILIGILFLSISPSVYSEVKTESDDSGARLNLIIAIDVSKSVIRFWDYILSAIFALIDDLQPGDKVLPVVFGTVARTLTDEVIIIRGGMEKLKLRKLFSELKPTDEWTYFRDVLRVADELASGDEEWNLLVISDCESDPGPGRIRDVDISQLAAAKDIFQEGEVYVIRLMKNRDKTDASILTRLRQEDEELRSKGVIPAVTVTEDEELIDLIHEFIRLLKEDNELIKQFFESRSVVAEPPSELSKESATDTEQKKGGKSLVEVKDEPSASKEKTEHAPPPASKKEEEKALGKKEGPQEKREEPIASRSQKQEQKVSTLKEGERKSSSTKPASKDKAAPVDVEEKARGSVKKDYSRSISSSTSPHKPSSSLHEAVKKLKKTGASFVKWMKRNLVWMLVFFVLLACLFAVTRMLPKKKGTTAQRFEDATSKVDIGVDEAEVQYAIVVRGDSSDSASYPLIPGMMMTLGTDIPLPTVEHGIGDVRCEKGRIVLYPRVDGVFVDEREVHGEIEVVPGNVIRYRGVSMRIADESTSGEGEIYEDLGEPEEVSFYDDKEIEEGDIFDDEDFSLR